MIQIEEREQLRQENQALREANENWQACVHEAVEAILRKQGVDLLSALDQTLAGHPVLPAFS